MPTFTWLTREHERMDARTNQLTASFPSETAKRVYCEFAAASDACYNSINHRRQHAYFSDGESV